MKNKGVSNSVHPYFFNQKSEDNIKKQPQVGLLNLYITLTVHPELKDSERHSNALFLSYQKPKVL